MRRPLYAAILIVATGGAFLGGYWSRNRPTPGAPPASARRILYYHDPMHPSYRSDTPGIAPDCGMDLEPVYEGGDATATSPFPGAVQISLEKQQITGVRVSAVQKATVAHTLRLFGRVAPDETRVYRLNAGVDGFIREVSSVTTGSQVKKGQVLATFSAPDVFPAIQAYLVALSAKERMTENSVLQADPTRGNIQQRLDVLEILGMSREQIEEVGRLRAVPHAIRVLSPTNGFVITRNVAPGQRFEHGTEWYRIADLSRVWVLTDLFGREQAMVRPGMKARVLLPDRDLIVNARVSDVLPQFDPATLSLKVRLEADNPGYVLRPDMLVDVEVPIDLPPSIAVPVDAVIDSGLTKTVFVDRGEGFFEPREVRTGWRLGDRVEIVQGLTPGERIVVSGTFLIDSESRMKASNSAGSRASTGAVGGASTAMPDVSSAALPSRSSTTTVPGSSTGGAPTPWTQATSGVPTAAAPGAATAAVPDASTKDPVCGMEIDEDKARTASRVQEYQGKSYFFCSDGCKRRFAEGPARFASVADRGMPGSAHGRDHRLD